jgi:hypothetical protein
VRLVGARLRRVNNLVWAKEDFDQWRVRRAREKPRKRRRPVCDENGMPWL